MPIAEDCPAGGSRVTAIVSAAGLRPVRLEQDRQAITAFIGVGRLTPGARRPSLILVSGDGGSFGCAQIDVVEPAAGAFRRVRLGDGGGDGGTLCEVDGPGLAWPRDLSGHGHPEFVLADTRFHGRFTSNAGSWEPPRILALVDHRTVDVSADPALAQLFRADMVRARRECERRVHEAEGPCAGFAYDAARVGELPRAWRFIDAQVRRGCRVPTPDGACYEGDAVTSAFRARLAATLTKTGLR